LHDSASPVGNAVVGAQTWFGTQYKSSSTEYICASGAFVAGTRRPETGFAVLRRARLNAFPNSCRL
jgi:hypothetical protein